MNLILSVIEVLREWFFPQEYTFLELQQEFQALLEEYESFQTNIPEERNELSWFDRDFRNILVDMGKTGSEEEKKQFIEFFLGYRSGELIKYLPDNPRSWLKSKGF